MCMKQNNKILSFLQDKKGSSLLLAIQQPLQQPWNLLLYRLHH